MTEPTAKSPGKSAGSSRTDAPRSSLEKARVAANTALDTTLDGAHRAADRTAKAIEENPLPVLAGGLALGLLAGALVPRGQREIRLLAPVGRKLKTGASEAVSSAKQTGLAELGALGLSKGALSDNAGKLVGGILTALATAGTAAISASKDAKAKTDDRGERDA